MLFLWLASIAYLLHVGGFALAFGEDSTEKAAFPDPLNEEEFNSQMRSGLHIVEFFSPHCSHCKALAPTWKKAWETFYEEGQGLNITFSQVNCLLSGDLCNKEKIAYFPNIRLYGPSGFIKNFPENAKRTVENLIDFARREAYDPVNAEVLDIKSLSIPIRGDQFNELLAGKGEQPILVSFWPSKTMRSSDDNIDFENCDECIPFQRTWRILSSKLLAHNISTGHINCESSSNLCEELGFSDLVKIKNHSLDRLPRVALILPNRVVNNFFVYKSPFSTSTADYEDFATRIVSNSEPPFISAKEVREITEREFEIPSTNGLNVSPQKLHVVFSYDPETVVPEDLHVLGHLLEPLSAIPNAYLYRSTDNMNSASRSVFESMYQMINYNESEPVKTVKESFLDLNVMEQNPSLYVFKDGEKIPHIFPAYSTTEMRNVGYITSWIESVSLPPINEISPSTFERLLSFNPEVYSGLVIQLIDTSTGSKFEKSSRLLRKLIVGAYDYEDLRMQNVLNVADAKRLTKTKKMQALKKKGASAKKIVKASIEEIPRLDVHKIILGYIDISKSDNALSQLGLDYREEYNLGDVIVIDILNRYVYEHDIFGNALSSESPYNVRETLAAVFLPESSYSAGNIPRRVWNPSFGDVFRFFDFTGQVSFWRFFCILSLILLAYKALRLLSRARINKRYKAKRNIVGLLGKADKKNLRD
ncbi:hypothetical protein HG536_0F03080 [Torulaspora globosa]|uniref:Thioredoxin domain-containing protein n=1 Tax=Torulaspora globosa TaxID=48254 RepID=A0A7G3ZKE7_9SACH|nr:uncharacterized protein HG536_0F03080 [Torulaspora globosa]QLL33983.1 hypothetical protein HG536_0F03080 [Torulaspora globosa]